MKQILLLYFTLILSSTLFAQLSEDFSDGNFSNNPTWQGDVANFIVNTDNQLQLSTSGSDTSVLFTAVEMPDSLAWEFEFNLDFAPSTNNRLRIYLQSNTTNYPDIDGYYLEIGESSTTDALRLFRIDNGNRTAITSGMEGALGTDPAMAKVKVTRSSSGDWSIFANYDGGNILNLEATGFDDTYLGGNLFFGFWCKNSSTNAEKFFFDNIAITPLLPDLTAPSVIDIKPLSLTEVEISFDEAVDSLTAATISNYAINNGIGNPQNVTWNNANQSKVILTLSNPLVNLSSYNLDIQNVKDRADNPITSTTIPFNVNFEIPTLINVVAISSTELELEFNQDMENISGSLLSNYSVDNGIGIPDDADVDIAEPNRVYLEFLEEFQNGQSYMLQVDNLKSAIGIEMPSQSIPFDFLIGDNIATGDIIINEILFNPNTGGSDFVEIYNNSDKFIDISDLFISNTQRTIGRDKDIETSHILRPEEYAVLTPDREFILNNYTVQDPDVLFENPLPGYNDADGNVSLFTILGLDTIMVDSFDYEEGFHYPLLDDKEGISLERISFDSPTQGKSNWHSASTVIGGATPTFQNSQLRPSNPADGIFTIADPVFSPNEDGFKDFLLIDYSLETQGYLATINIYDAKGRLVRKLFQNELLGLEGTLKWDGLTDEGRKTRIGIYVILAEIFSPEKEVMEFKQTCVVGGNLD